MTTLEPQAFGRRFVSSADGRFLMADVAVIGVSGDPFARFRIGQHISESFD
jgi:hypothetical protein